MKRNSPRKQQVTPENWRRPDFDQSKLQHRFGHSILSEFVRGHGPSEILRELVQNEYDAGGSRLEVRFEESGLAIRGNGAPIGRKGWRRLSVTLGTGLVSGFDGEIEAKANGIGSKNFGLRSLFLFGDYIYVRSNGHQTVLDLRRGVPQRPIQDKSSVGTRGVMIYVPYRTEPFGNISPFTTVAEREVLDNFAAQISPTLLKLAQPGARKSLREVVVSSLREERRITWRQTVKRLGSPFRGGRALMRRISMTDTELNSRDLIEEVEWQRRIELPHNFRDEHIPGYFRGRGDYIWIGVSLRTKRRKLHPSAIPGIIYYPIGVEHAYTGNKVSISAPFTMDSDRSDLVSPSNSPFNAWLLDQAKDMTIELLQTNWFREFGVDAYRAVGEINHSTVPKYSEAVVESLRSEKCWPRRERPKQRKRRVQFARANGLNIIDSPFLDEFLDGHRYLHPALCNDSGGRELALSYGVRTFTANSLVRLRCAGEETDSLETKLTDKEAQYFYKEFPAQWNDFDIQQRCAKALDAHRKDLSRENRRDLARSATTITAAETLGVLSDLWCAPKEVTDVCAIPADQRLHPSLSQCVVLKRLCKRFDMTRWILEVTRRVADGEAEDDERFALYRYVMSVSGRIPRRALTAVRKAPVFLDNKGNWVAPKSLTLPSAPSASRFRSGLRLPHNEYAKDQELAKALRFKNRVTSDDVVRFAKLVVKQPRMAEQFERALERSKNLLTGRTIERLQSIAFLRSNDGTLHIPQDLCLDNPRTRVCIGPEGLFPAGKLKSLYARLGCRRRPSVQMIMGYLEALRLNGAPPPRPDVLYPEFVAALERESTSDQYEDEEILWTEQGYSNPADTLVGTKWKEVFLGAVASVTGLGVKLERAYAKLGASRRPQQRHWERLLVVLGERYQLERNSLSSKERSAIRSAYNKCIGNPSVPSNVPWLLDDLGRLHLFSEIDSGKFVIEDDLALADRLRELGVPISFADDKDTSVVSLFRGIGVKHLTVVRERVGHNIGKTQLAPKWFNEDESVRRLRGTDFGSALERLASRDLLEAPGSLENVRGTIERLSLLKRIVFADDLSVNYRIVGNTVTVSGKSLWEDDTVYLTSVRSRQGLNSLLSSLISRECMPGSIAAGRLADGIYRLIICRNNRDIQDYLEERGIRWHPVNDEDGLDHDSEDYMDEVEEALRASVHPSITPVRTDTASIPRGGNGDLRKSMGDERDAGNGKDDTASVTLPPIGEVIPRISMPSDKWSYSEPDPKRGGGGGGGWGLPTRQSEERDREIGRRGEEIVHRFEQARVRELGYPEDRVVWVSDSDPGADFDIQSVDDDGNHLFIEVKSTSGSDGKFHWSMPEFQRALRERDSYVLYRVYQADERSPIVRAFRNPISLMAHGALHLDIGSLRAEVEPSG